MTTINKLVAVEHKIFEPGDRVILHYLDPLTPSKPCLFIRYGELNETVDLFHYNTEVVRNGDLYQAKKCILLDLKTHEYGVYNTNRIELLEDKKSIWS